MFIKIKRMFFLLALVCIFGVNTVFAQESLNTNANLNLSIGEISIKEIDISEIPADIGFIEFETAEEMQLYISNLESSLTSLEPSDVYLNINTKATHGSAVVQSLKKLKATISLCINYGTTLDSHRGKISYISPYTMLTGYTVGMRWEQSNVGFEISSSGKDAYVYGNGVLSYYLVLENVSSLVSYPINLGGTVYLVR